MEDNIHASYIWDIRKWSIADVMRPAKFFKELGLQTSYFWGETIHFFLAISKTIYLFPARRETIYLF